MNTANMENFAEPDHQPYRRAARRVLLVMGLTSSQSDQCLLRVRSKTRTLAGLNSPQLEERVVELVGDGLNQAMILLKIGTGQLNLLGGQSPVYSLSMALRW